MSGHLDAGVFPAANNFRAGKPVVLLNPSRNAHVQRNVSEQERLLGYASGITAAAGVTKEERFCLTGQCMDANQLRAVFFTALALDDMLHTLLNCSLQPYDATSQAMAQVQLQQQPPILDDGWPHFNPCHLMLGALSPQLRGTGSTTCRVPLRVVPREPLGWSHNVPEGSAQPGPRWPLKLPCTSAARGLGVTSSSATAAPTALVHTSSTPAADAPVAGGGVALDAHPARDPVAAYATALLLLTSPCHHDQLCCYHSMVELSEAQ